VVCQESIGQAESVAGEYHPLTVKNILSTKGGLKKEGVTHASFYKQDA
jgi:hypothetical protein